MGRRRESPLLFVFQYPVKPILHHLLLHNPLIREISSMSSHSIHMIHWSINITQCPAIIKECYQITTHSILIEVTQLIFLHHSISIPVRRMISPLKLESNHFTIFLSFYIIIAELILWQSNLPTLLH